MASAGSGAVEEQEKMEEEGEAGGDSADKEYLISGVNSDAGDTNTKPPGLGENGETADAENTSTEPTPAPKPLKSILKKRTATESAPSDDTGPEDKPDPDNILTKKPAFGGSITEALKKITEVKVAKPDVSLKDGKKSNEPVPSAFIQEMEKQRDLLPALGTFGCPEGIDMVWGDKHGSPEPESFFLREQRRKAGKKYKKSIEKYADEKHSQMATRSIPKEEQFKESVVLINNLPFKVTAKTLVLVLGVWPKDGYNGVKIIYDLTGVPAGYAYVILERHSDTMDVVKMTGMEVDGRKIRVHMSNHEALQRDMKTTKEALLKIDLSRVVRVGQLPFNLKKSELIDTMREVSFTEDDIYWKPLKAGQQNSGRGYVVLKSSLDVKKLAGKTYVAQGRTLDVRQIHPAEMMKFCDQCALKIHEDHDLHDPLPDNIDEVPEEDVPFPVVEGRPSSKSSRSNFMGHEDINDVRTWARDGRPSSRNTYRRRSPPRTRHRSPERTMPIPLPRKKRKKKKKKRKAKTDAPNVVDMEIGSDHSTDQEESGSEGTASSDGEMSSAVGRCEPEPPRGRQFHLSRPPFPPTVHVRMYNVPDKASTKDIMNFFAPLLPAKISDNVGYDIYDIQFHNPDDSWKAMGKHLLLIRKNVITLEMLPGPPTPLPPRPIIYRPPSPLKKGKNHGKAIHPSGLYPPGAVLSGPEPLPPGIPSGMGPPPMMARFGAPPGFAQGPPHPIPRPIHPGMGPRMLPMEAELGRMHPRPTHPDMGPRPMPVLRQGPPPPPVMPPGISPGMPPADLNLRPILTGPPPFMPPPGAMGPTTLLPGMHRPMHPAMPMRLPSHPDNSKNQRSSNLNGAPQQMHSRGGSKHASAKAARKDQEEVEKEKEHIPVPPLPQDITKYEVPSFDGDTPTGQAMITPMQGFFCQLCNKFYSSQKSAKVTHCKSRGHYDKLQQFLQEKKRLRKLAAQTS